MDASAVRAVRKPAVLGGTCLHCLSPICISRTERHEAQGWVVGWLLTSVASAGRRSARVAMSCPTLMNKGPRLSMVSRVQAASFLVRALFLHCHCSGHAQALEGVVAAAQLPVAGLICSSTLHICTKAARRQAALRFCQATWAAVWHTLLQ